MSGDLKAIPDLSPRIALWPTGTWERWGWYSRHRFRKIPLVAGTLIQ